MPKRCPTEAEEAWLAKQLDRPLELYLGTITPADRMQRVRARILEGGYGDRRAGYRGGDPASPETFAEVFARLYGEPL